MRTRGEGILQLRRQCGYRPGDFRTPAAQRVDGLEPRLFIF